MIPQETVDLILDTARIEDVVGDFVTLKRRGANYVACCPFHNEKTPSFYVSPAKGLYKCFGCGKSGSAVGFVMEHEHYSYVEALRYLASRYHIEIQETEINPEEIMARQRRESLLLVSEFAQKFYNAQLASGEGRAVGYRYFQSRGLQDETIAAFGLGWAPSGRTALIDAAVKEGYKLEYLIDAGLAVKRDDGSIVDKFHERVMFPIHSVSGRVVAFSGRTLKSDNPAKYVNTAETEIYIKSRNLLGIYFAKSQIARLGKCILVEGNVDMVTMHQLGLTNVVASCGTSLTVEQIRLIKKFTENVTIMYDGDSAGIHAALRGINLVLAEGLNVKIVLLPDGEDPDSFARKHTLEEVSSFIESGERDFIEFKSDLLLGEAGNDPLKRANLINDIADTIAQIPDAVKRSVYVDSCALKFKIESDILFDRVSKTRQHKLAEEQAAERREVARQRTEDRGWQEPYVPSEETVPAEDTATGYIPENRTLAKAESELVSFLLQYGREQLDFPSDSDYYSGDENDKPTVADFIRSGLEADDTVFANSAYRKVYDFYMSLYDEGMEQDRILRRMFDAEDRQLADIAAENSTEKYQLSIQAFVDSLTATSSWLVTYVPKALISYSEKRVKDKMDNLRRSLATAEGGEQDEILAALAKYQVVYRRIRAKMGREK